MNLYFLIGKICSKINFQFILNSKNISIVLFDVQLLNGSKIKVKGYNELADYCYSNLKEEDVIAIQGRINNRYEIIIESIKRINQN